MKTRRIRAGLALAGFALLPGAAAGQESEPLGTPVAPPMAVTEHVILVSIDGLRPDAIEMFDLPHLGRLVREGSSSMEAATIVPSKTLPSHASMLTGVGPEVHGIDWNTHDPGRLEYVEVPTVFAMASRAGLSTAAFVAKAKLRHLLDPRHVDYFEAPASDALAWMAPRVVERALGYMRHRRPNLLMIHLGEPDYAGHSAGWMTPIYRWAVAQADAALGRVIEAADATYGPDGYTLIVTADHGGHRRDHGSADPVDRWIPWIAYGRGVARGTRLLPGIRTMDTAATIVWVLGLPRPAGWAGHPVVSAFDVEATAATTPRATTGGTP